MNLYYTGCHLSHYHYYCTAADYKCDPSGSDSAGQRGQTGKVVRENVKFQRAASGSFAGAGR